MFIETERLIIRRFRKDDWKDLYDYLSKPDVVEFEPYDTFSEKEALETAVERSTNDSFYAVELKSEHKVIGNLYFEQTDFKAFNTWELGYVFNSDYHGMGYATESCIKLLDFAFSDLEVRRVIALCNVKNTASQNLLKRLKMRHEGTFLQKGFFKHDESGNPIWHDVCSYGILKTEWQKIMW
ncbi:MAG TPA: GNAT family protein [Thermotogota bacterium]|nr:GNAT family protein [Thermotogota bacterium]